MNVQEQLLKDYANIRGNQSARDFAEVWGTPVHHLAPIDKLVAVNPDRYIKKDELQVMCESAASIRWLTMLASAITENNAAFLMKWAKVNRLKDGNYQVTFAPTKQDRAGALKNWTTFYWAGGFPDSLSLDYADYLDTPVFYSADRWKQHGERALLYAAQMYVSKVVNSNLQYIVPECGWQHDPQQDIWTMQLRYKVSCPWQAIIYALARKISAGVAFEECKRPDCRKLFSRKRRDKQTCSEACEAWCRRNGRGSREQYTDTQRTREEG